MAAVPASIPTERLLRPRRKEGGGRREGAPGEIRRGKSEGSARFSTLDPYVPRPGVFLYARAVAAADPSEMRGATLMRFA